jgi:hypothetical protein
MHAWTSRTKRTTYLILKNSDELITIHVNDFQFPQLNNSIQGNPQKISPLYSVSTRSMVKYQTRGANRWDLKVTFQSVKSITFVVESLIEQWLTMIIFKPYL